MTLLFDLDGTLVDCKDLHYEALNRALEIHNKPIITRDDHETIYDGLPTVEKLRKLGILHEEATQINNTKQELTLSLVEDCIEPSQLMLDALKQVKGRYKLFVVSNSQYKTIVAILKKVGIYEMFDSIISCEQVEHPKPAPDIYEYALNIAKDQVLAFEDNEKGVVSAQMARIPCIRVTDSTHLIKILCLI